MRVQSGVLFAISTLLRLSQVTAFSGTVGASASIGSFGPGLAVDDNLSESSRWACHEELASLDGDPCEIWFSFDEPQDIDSMKLALYEGDEHTRAIRITFEDSNGDTSTATFPSSGTTQALETFYVFKRDTQKVTMRAVGLDEGEILGIIEVQFL